MPELRRIGEAFAARRRAVGLTQQMLADLAGVSRSGVQAIEYGQGTVKFASVVEVAGVLGLALAPAPAAGAS